MLTRIRIRLLFIGIRSPFLPKFLLKKKSDQFPASYLEKKPKHQEKSWCSSNLAGLVGSIERIKDFNSKASGSRSIIKDKISWKVKVVCHNWIIENGRKCLIRKVGEKSFHFVSQSLKLEHYLKVLIKYQLMLRESFR